ncbi:polycystin-1-like isoform X2, partial [Brachionus plicatilis]
VNSRELTILNSLFLSNKQTFRWKVEFTVNTISQSSGITTGKSSLILQINQMPKHGTCSISNTEGYSAETEFTIECLNWKDDDGYIKKYLFSAVYLDDPVKVGLASTVDGKLVTKLPQGAPYNSYKLSIEVQIYDNEDGFVIYKIPDEITVRPNLTAFVSYSNLLSPKLLDALNNGDSKSSVESILGLTSLLNVMSLSDKKSLSETSNSSTVLSSSYGPGSSFSGIKPSNVDEKKFEENRNERADLRDYIANFVNNLSISDVSSVKSQASMLKELTSQTDEVTRNLGDVVTNQCIRLALSLKSMSEKTAVEDIQQSIFGIANTLGNTLTGLSTILNERGTTLNKDFERAVTLPDYYDTDLENFWTQPKNFMGDDGTETSKEEMDRNMNIQRQKFDSVDKSQKTSSVIDLLSNVLSDHSAAGETTEVLTPNLGLKVEKLKASSLQSELKVHTSEIRVPSFCDLQDKSAESSTERYNPDDENNCANKIITLQGTSFSAPSSGHNGKNESKIGLSTSLGLSFFDQNGDEVTITNSKKPIHIWIPRERNLPDYPFQHVNTSNLTISSGGQILPNSFAIDSDNSSIHLEIRPDIDLTQINSIGYLVLIKFGLSPVLNSSHKIYDHWQIVCPHTAIKSSSQNLTQHVQLTFFMNISQVKGHKGFTGYGIRQLTQTELDSHCPNSSLTEPPVISNDSQLFTSDFSVRVYTSGCYYLDKYSGKWRSDGMEILPDSTLEMAHCQSTHLTQFAGGLVVLPSKINFEHVFANASFLQNPVIYSTVIAILALYVISGVWAYVNDRRDKKRAGLTVLQDKYSTNSYFYEVIVFTGSRQNAATDSKVSLILSGDGGDTEPRHLMDKKRKVLRRGGIDSFLMGVDGPLGNLNYVRIWHDNGGKGNMASWYLKFVIVHDVQTREKHYFLCEKWLGVEKGDGLIDRILPIAGEKQKTEIKYLIKKQAKQNMRDSHLWFSVFARPVQSTFTRLDRITCCFVLLCITMLMNILYYELDSAPNTGGIDIGPFRMTTQQIGIGIMTNLLTFPPCFLLIQLFRRSKARKTKHSQIKKILDENSNKMSQRSETNLGLTDIRNEQTTPVQTPFKKETNQNFKFKESNKYVAKKTKRKLLFPWWTKIIAYILSFCFAGVSLFFVVIKGIEFGDEKVKKWITSLFVSFLTSVLLTQPIQTLLVAFFFVIIFRKYDESLDNEQDPDDKGDSLNQLYDYSKFKHSSDQKMNANSSELKILKNVELEAARKRRLREVKVWDALREIVIYFVFLCILFSVCYTNNGSQPYQYQKMVKKIFEPKFKNINQFWTWSIDKLTVGLRAETWYNSHPPYTLAGFLNDKTSRMLGYATIRQVRVKQNSCDVIDQFKSHIPFCDDDLSLFNHQDANFGFSWSSFNESFKPAHGSEEIYRAFQYRDSSSLETFPLYGSYNSYLGGGYVYELRGRKEYLRGNLSQLQLMNWIDRQTRAVIVEFSAYNPNLNLIIAASILVEILPSGNILTTARFDPLNIFNEIKSNSHVLKLVLDGIYMLFIAFFMVKQIFVIVKSGLRNYLKQFWNYIEWGLIVCSWTAFGIFIYRLSKAYEILDFFKKTNGYGYLNLQRINYWNQLLTIFMAFCATFGTLKFLRLFRFNNRIYAIANTLKFSIRQLLGFSLVFFIIWFAFVQLIYLFYYEKIWAYYTVFSSATTSFQIMLGKFDSSSIIRESEWLGPIIFSAYNIMIVLILLNLFISIVCDAFEQVRQDIETKENEIELVDYFMEQIDGIFGGSRQRRDANDVSSGDYVENYQHLPGKIDDLLNTISESADQNERYLKQTKQY